MATPLSPDLAPLVLLACGGLAVFCLGALQRKGLSQLLFVVSVATVLSAGWAAVWLGPSVPAAGGLLDTGGYSRFFSALFCLLTALLLLFARPYAERRDIAGDELYGLLVWACLGMALVAAATHWMTFFLGFELLSLCFYVLVALPRSASFAGEAGIKYFFVGAVASAFLAFGIGVLYAATGTLSMAESVADAGRFAGYGTAARPWALLGLACLFAGVGLKLSLVPFHLWTPDVYQGAPAPVAAFLATGSKIAVFGAVLRLYLSAGGAFWAASVPILAPMAALTVWVGAVGALTQPRVKRLLAYSSVAQMGYLLLALLGIREGGAAAALFYSVGYAAMDLGAFGILGALSPPSPQEDLDLLRDIRGIGYRAPWRSAVLVTCLVSLAGFPPTAGFVGKLAVFVSVFRSGLGGLAVIALLAVVPAAYLYLRVAIALFLRPCPTASGVGAAPEARFSESVAGAAVVALLLWLGLFPSPLLSLLARLVPSGF